ncbi:MAG: macro domain-containing protein [Clostridia bacterium]|nr:macro domain-containing protein [Clostridia bacterium]MEE1126388.1 macro domain-containing protein [Acutalibacteraceae bacterium]
MLTYLRGDLLSSPAQVQVNTVNVVGVMGKGIALQFKNKYPEMFKSYRQICEKHLFDVGNLYLWKSSKKWVLLFPTKKHWRNPSKIEYIESGLKKFVENYDRLGIESIAFPKLGCGNGNLDWNIVKPIMEKYLKPLPINIYIYIDNYNDFQPEHTDDNFIEWLHSNPRDLSFNELKEELLAVIKNNNQILYADGFIKYIEWDKNILLIKNGREITVKEDEFCDFWDYIRNVGIIEINKIPESYTPYAEVLLKLLNKLKYLQPVLISSDENKIDTSYGYQYSED